MPFSPAFWYISSASTTSSGYRVPNAGLCQELLHFVATLEQMLTVNAQLLAQMQSRCPVGNALWLLQVVLVRLSGAQSGQEAAEAQLLAFLEEVPEEHGLRLVLARLYEAVGQSDKAQAVTA